MLSFGVSLTLKGRLHVFTSVLIFGARDVMN